MLNKAIFSIFLTLSLLFPNILKADVSFEFEGLFPNAVMKNFLNSVNGSYQDKNIDFAFNVNDFVEGFSVNNFLFDYNLDLEVSLDTKSGDLGGYFVLPKAVLKANQVDLVYETTSVVGGVEVKVKTKLECSVAYLNMESVAGFVRGALAIEDGVFKFDKPNARMELGDLSKAFSIDLKNCSGVKGLESVIKQELIDWLKSESGKTEILNIVVDAVIDFINKKLSEYEESGYMVPFVNKMIKFKIESGYFLNEGFSFKGETSFKAKEDKHYPVSNNISPQSKAAVLRLPKQFARKILPVFLKSSEQVGFNFERSAFPQADILFNNRLVQFLVWSDLLNFRKTSNFNLNINLKPEQFVLQSQSSNTLGFHLYAKHKSDLDFKNSKEKLFPYMDFNGELSSKVLFSFSNTGFSISISKFAINSDSAWDVLMSSWRKTRSRGKPWMSFILKQVSKALGNTSYSWTWGDFGLSVLEFKTVKINSSSDDFDLEFTF